MVQPYALRLERLTGGKPQLTVHPTMAHHLASRILLQKQPSLDDRQTSYPESATEGNSGASGGGGGGRSTGKFIRRQGSVECTEKKLLQAFGHPEQELKRKIKNTMISVYGALTAIEQDDLDSLRMILSKNSVPINDSVCESSLYSHFSLRVTLLDVALMLNRQSAVSLLLQHGATENPELSAFERRKLCLERVLSEYGDKVRQLREKAAQTKEEEKRLRLMDQHFNTLRKMRGVLEQHEVPGAPAEVKVQVSSSSTATVEFCAPSSTGRCAIIKYKVEWSTSQSFEEIAGFRVVSDLREAAVKITGLEHGRSYTFRVSAGSMWGFGEPTTASPKNLRISSWEDLDGVQPDRAESMRAVAKLYEQVERHKQSAVWQVVFPGSCEAVVKKKKTGLRNLFSASSKFVKNVGRGTYLVSVIYTEDKILCTVDDCLPVILVDENITSVATDDVGWLMKLSLCWDQVSSLQDSIGGAWSSNAPLRAKVLEAVVSMHNALGVKDIGRVHHIPITYSNMTTFLVTVHFVTENQANQSQGLAMRWMRLSKLLRKKINPPLDCLSKELVNILNFFESSQIPLDRGLYLGYLRMQSSLNTIRVTVPDNLPSVLPFVTVRSNPHVSQEEWEWLCMLDRGDSSARPSTLQHTFHQQIIRSANILLRDLDLDSDLIPSHRLFRMQILQVHPDVSFIVIFPRAEDVCSVHATYSAVDEYNDHCKGCTAIPVPVFEMISFSTYQPDFIATYARLSVFLEHFITIIGYEKRQCLRDSDSRVYSDQYDKLVEFHQKLEDIWRSARWISSIASLARDKQSNCGITMQHVLVAPPPPLPEDNVSDVGYHSDQGGSSQRLNEQDSVCVGVEDMSEVEHLPRSESLTKIDPLAREPLGRSKSVVERGELRLASIDRLFQEDNVSTHSESDSNHNLPCQPNGEATLDILNKRLPQLESPPHRLSGIIRVFAAFECALPPSTAIRLSITPLTTAREIVALVIEQINKLSLLASIEEKQLPHPDDFCLVSVVGARERRLRDEFPPMRLLPPWTRGRLFVRRIEAVSAAILFGNESFV